MIQIALAVTAGEGYPILHKIYEGNINGVKILEDLMTEMESPESYQREEARYMGYSLIYQNCGISAGKAVKKYYERDIVEKAFKAV
ncbi:hypothetical protein [Thermodesulfovibrio hydrogeniphilus]